MLEYAHYGGVVVLVVVVFGGLGDGWKGFGVGIVLVDGDVRAFVVVGELRGSCSMAVIVSLGWSWYGMSVIISPIVRCRDKSDEVHSKGDLPQRKAAWWSSLKNMTGADW